MALAERLETLNGPPQVLVDLMRCKERVRRDLRNRPRVAGDERLDAFAKRRRSLRPDREAGRGGVTAVADELVAGRSERVDGGDARRAADASLAARHDERRPVEALEQLAGDDAHHAGVPGVVADDDRRGGGVHLGQRRLEHLVLDPPALVVARVEVDGELARLALAAAD